MSERRVRSSYDRKFKLSVVRLVLKKYQPVARVARDLGVSVNSLHNWKQQFLKDSGDIFPVMEGLRARMRNFGDLSVSWL